MPVVVQYHAEHDNVYRIKLNAYWSFVIFKKQAVGERYQCDKHKEKYIYPHKVSVSLFYHLELHLLPYPEHSQHQEADNIILDLRQKCQERAYFRVNTACNMRQPDIKYQQGHCDREHPV